jgi:hypothetical protein
MVFICSQLLTFNFFSETITFFSSFVKKKVVIKGEKSKSTYSSHPKVWCDCYIV